MESLLFLNANTPLTIGNRIQTSWYFNKVPLT
jgi:hypothetical protein